MQDRVNRPTGQSRLQSLRPPTRNINSRKSPWMPSPRSGSANTAPSRSRCNGQGLEEHEELVQLSVPARLRDGAVFPLPLRGLGIHGLFLELMFRVGGLRG